MCGAFVHSTTTHTLHRQLAFFFFLYTIYSVYQLKSVSPVLLISPLNNFISLHAHDSMRRSVRMCERRLLLTSFIRIAVATCYISIVSIRANTFECNAMFFQPKLQTHILPPFLLLVQPWCCLNCRCTFLYTKCSLHFFFFVCRFVFDFTFLLIE